jgi:hypothetical protein
MKLSTHMPKLVSPDDPEYGKADAEVYQIVVAMAENLVPDVCALIMGFLEDIHVELGRKKWNEKVRKLNMTYYSMNPLEFRNGGHHYLLEYKHTVFSFNWRDFHDPGYFPINVIYNIKTGQQWDCHVAPIPYNY